MTVKLATSILLLASATGLQSQPPDPARTQFADQLDIRLVHVDVRVERRSKPVTDLRIEDFVLLEDGEPVEIAVFSPPDGGGSGAETLSSTDIPASVTTQASGAERDGTGLGTVAVFVDDISLPPGQRKRALRTIEALSDTASLGSHDLLIFRHFQRGRLTLQQSEEATVAPDDFEGMSRAAAAREQRAIVLTMQEAQSALEFLSCIDARGQLLSIADSYAANAFASSQMRSQLLNDAIEYLSPLPGRKLLVVISGRIELQPGVAILHLLQELCPDLESELSSRILSAQSMATRLHRVAGLANSHRVTLVTVDARGISAPVGTDASLNAARFGGSQLNQMISDANLQSGLTQLASETGGSVILNANNIAKPVLASLEQADATYTLAFYPTHERTGDRHSLEVRLTSEAKGKTKLRYRRSYVDRTTPQVWADSLRTAARAPELRPDSTLPNPLGARLSVSTVDSGLVASLSLDAQAVATLMGLSSQSERRLRLWLYVVDPEGRETAAREGFLAAPTDPGPWQANVRLNLPAGEWTVAAGLRDEVTGEISLLRYTPPAPPQRL